MKSLAKPSLKSLQPMKSSGLVAEDALFSQALVEARLEGLGQRGRRLLHLADEGFIEGRRLCKKLLRDGDSQNVAISAISFAVKCST